MIVRSNRGITTTNDGDPEFSEMDHIVELREGESLKINVAGGGENSVSLRVVNGTLIPQDADKRLTPLSKMLGISRKELELLDHKGIRTAEDISSCTYDTIEAFCGSSFATTANHWLKGLGLRIMKC